MYKYDGFDKQIVLERVSQFRDQTNRYLSGSLSEKEFTALRLRNGLYVQRYSPMLRVSIPYGLLSSAQLRQLADVADCYDKGYGHFTTRQNIQFNWVRLERVPDILEQLAQVEMHSIQTSGNCVRNVSSDPFAGVAQDEVMDPRPVCELLRQWSTFHPEFSHLPRKFKIAVSGSKQDRAAIHFHDIGIQLCLNPQSGRFGAQVFVGGGLGRTPVIGQEIRSFLPLDSLLTYCEAILRVYNLHGRRDNRYKSRIKILVKSLGIEAFKAQVEEEWSQIAPIDIAQTELSRLTKFFAPPAYGEAEFVQVPDLAEVRKKYKEFSEWLDANVIPHRQMGYHIVILSLKKTGVPPGDINSEQMRLVADLADQFSFGGVRVTHEQNLVLTDVAERDLFRLWKAASQMSLATPNFRTLTDIITCPGGDFCSLANARSIPVTQAIQERFDQMDYLYDLGELELNISGCMNACSHHHIGYIGILGVDKNGEEWYQVTIGGSQGRIHSPSIGTVIGPSFSAQDIPDVIEKLVKVYVDNREEEEDFLSTYRRIGISPFKFGVYGNQRKQRRERGAAQ